MIPGDHTILEKIGEGGMASVPFLGSGTLGESELQHRGTRPELRERLMTKVTRLWRAIPMSSLGPELRRDLTRAAWSFEQDARRMGIMRGPWWEP